METLGCTPNSYIIEIIHQVPINKQHVYNLQDNYIDKYNPWKVIISAVALAVSQHII